jgi:hypothetical protein
MAPGIGARRSWHRRHVSSRACHADTMEKISWAGGIDMRSSIPRRTLITPAPSHCCGSEDMWKDMWNSRASSSPAPRASSLARFVLDAGENQRPRWVPGNSAPGGSMRLCAPGGNDLPARSL